MALRSHLPSRLVEVGGGLVDGAVRLRYRGDMLRAKRDHELRFWREARAREGRLSNRHYEEVFTGTFGHDRGFYAGKRMLDVGCGPRGSLEWATDAAERVGVDPLVGRYREFGIDGHAMTYVETGIEDLPFDDDHFDVVSSFNSLDHVDDLPAAIGSICRVLAPGGHFLLVVEIDHRPRVTEPHALERDVLRRFEPDLEVVFSRHYEKVHHGVYETLRAGLTFDAGRRARRAGLLVAELRKRKRTGATHGDEATQ